MDITRGRKDVSEVEREFEDFKADVEQNGFLANQTEVFHIYLSAANGSDNNDGRSPDTPVATLARAYAIMPLALSAPCVVHMGGGTYKAEMLSRLQINNSARIWHYGDGAGQAGDDGSTELLAAEAATGGSTTTLLNVTSSLTPGALAGATVEILTGPGAGNKKTIATNDASSITPCGSFTVAPTTGSTFRVIEPAVQIDIGNLERDSWISGIGSATSGGATGPWAAFVNVEIYAAGVTNIPTIFNSSILLHGVKTSTSFGPFYANTVVNAGATNLFDFALGTDLYEDIGEVADTANLWHGWGLSHPGGVQVWNGFNSNFTGFIQSPGEVSFRQNSIAELFGGRVQTLSITERAHVRINAAQQPDFVVEGNNAAGSVVVQNAGFESGGPNTVINNTGSGPCIHAKQGAVVFWDSFTTPSGAASGAAGVKASGGKIVFEGAPTITGSTPGTNDAELDNGTVSGNAAFSGAGTGISNLGSVVQRIS